MGNTVPVSPPLRPNCKPGVEHSARCRWYQLPCFPAAALPVGMCEAAATVPSHYSRGEAAPTRPPEEPPPATDVPCTRSTRGAWGL